MKNGPTAIKKGHAKRVNMTCVKLVKSPGYCSVHQSRRAIQRLMIAILREAGAMRRGHRQCALYPRRDRTCSFPAPSSLTEEKEKTIKTVCLGITEKSKDLLKDFRTLTLFLPCLMWCQFTGLCKARRSLPTLANSQKFFKRFLQNFNTKPELKAIWNLYLSMIEANTHFPGETILCTTCSYVIHVCFLASKQNFSSKNAYYFNGSTLEYGHVD